MLLTLGDYLSLVENGACDYCGGSLPPYGHGIDRIDSSKPYILGNCKPCCKHCNEEKRKLSFREWMAVCVERWKKKTWDDRLKDKNK